MPTDPVVAARGALGHAIRREAPADEIRAIKIRLAEAKADKKRREADAIVAAARAES